MHYHGHQQALIKDNICIVSLSFPEHNKRIFKKTFKKFNYDYVVDTCSLKEVLEQDPIVGSYWNGSQFLWCPYPSWSYDENTKSLRAPVDPPYKILDTDNERWVWNEDALSWDLEKRSDLYIQNKCCPDLN